MTQNSLSRRVTAVIAISIGSPTLAQVADTQPRPAPQTQAAESQQQPKPPSTLTGEWGGLRTRIRDAGIDLSAGYVSEFATNVAGGQRKDATETGQLSLGATVDTQKLIGLAGGTLQASITYRRGHSLGDRASLGVNQQVQEVYGRGQTWRLTEFWYQQQLGRGVDIKLGRLPQGADFNSFSCNFENLSWCGAPAGNIAGDYWYNWPVSQWGARLRLKRPNWYVMAGAYENNPNELDNAFYISRGGATGVLAVVETGWTPRLGANQLPGSYRVGGWYNTSNADDVLLDRNGRAFAVTGTAPLRRSGRYGGYVLLQQQLTGSASTDAKGQPQADKGLTVFLNLTQADRRTERTDSQLAAGLFWTGGIPGRAQDDIGFGLARTHINGRAAEATVLATPGAQRPRSEFASELYYSAHLRPWLILRPNVQYVIDPGGLSSLPNVAILGLKSAVTF